MALVLAAVSGCGSKPSWAAGEKRDRVDLESGVALDEGRLLAFSPTGWKRAPKSKDCLIRYTPASQQEMPSITITATDPPAGVAELTAERLADAAKAIAAAVTDDRAPGAAGGFIEEPQSVMLGDKPAVAWAAPGTINVNKKQRKVERRVIVVIIGGRMYAVTVQTPLGKPDEKAFAAARGVADALAVPAKDVPAGGSGAAGDPAANTPAGSGPAEGAKPAAAAARD